MEEVEPTASVTVAVSRYVPTGVLASIVIIPVRESMVIPGWLGESAKLYGAVPRVALRGERFLVLPAVVQKLHAENLLLTGVITTALLR